jgi:hypothetical protein
MISYAPPSYSYDELGNDVFGDFKGENNYGRCALNYKEFAPGYEFPRYVEIRATEIIKSYWTTCMYIFVPKLWVDEVGVDKFGSFNTEEFNQSLRTFAHGWSVYAVGAKDVFHQHHDSPLRHETKAIRRPWGDDRKDAYWEHVKEATNHLGRILKGLEDIPLKKVEEFFEAASIDKSWLHVEGDYFGGLGGTTYQGVPPNPKGYSA